MVKDAQTESAVLLEKAQSERVRRLEKAKNEAREMLKHMIEEAKEPQKYEHLISEAKNEAIKIINSCENKISDTAYQVMEYILELDRE